MSFNDFHVHSNFCDGKDSIADIVDYALTLGVCKLGLSCHSYVDFDDCCISKNKYKNYFNEIAIAQQKHKNKILILTGIEHDYFSDIDHGKFDYVIGSVHYLKINNNYYSVDYTKELFLDIINQFFNGDFYSFCEQYFKIVGDVKNKTKCNIVGHFDLISKFNENDNIFDSSNSRYRNAWMCALDSIGCKNTIFEINSGAISRGYRTDFYPSKEIRKYINENGGKFIFSSDSHSKESICYKFEDMEKLALEENLNLVSSPV